MGDCDPVSDFFFFSSRRRHTRCLSDWSSDVCSSDLLVELDEILGHHLEQAARYKAELGQPDPELAERAGERLASAGRRSLGRGDGRAARRLLARSLELTRLLRLDVHLEVDLADAQESPQEQAAIATEAARRA